MAERIDDPAFDTVERREQLVRGLGDVLHGMLERAELMGGQLRFRSSIGRGSVTAPRRPPAASLSSAGPPGYGRPRSLAVLSNASPAASSSVSPSIR